MPTYFKYQLVDEADAIDENGCLKDKHSVRVSMRDALASRNQQDDVAARQAMSDAAQRVADYMEAQRKNFYNKPGYRMRATVVETPKGPYFIKMTGPAKTVDLAGAAFDQFLQSLNFK